MATENTTTPVDVGVFDASVGVFDASLFEDAVAKAPVTEAAPAEKIVEAEQPRDEQGKFAAKTETAKVETQPKVETPLADDDKGQVPSWRVREINDEKRQLAEKLTAGETEREQLRQQLATYQRQQKTAEQPKKEIPDPLIDPDGYRNHIRAEMQESLVNERREISLEMAHRTYKDEFVEAYKAVQTAMAQGDVAIAARMQRARDPGETLMAWHREQKTMREVGTDPNAFFEKRLETFLADPANQAKVIERIRGGAAPATGNGRPAINLPPSLSSVTRAGSTDTNADGSDLSDAALFAQAIRQQTTRS